MTDVKRLSAEELAEAQVQFALIRRIATNQNATVDIPTLLEGTGRLLATIDAQATEIAALKGALKALDLAHRRIRVHRRAQGGCGCWYDDGDSNRGWVADENCEFARVLAGKEAQCPKCEGRGFIRTMVDGERDSEPCSFCRMSGLAGKGAQGA